MSIIKDSLRKNATIKRNAVINRGQKDCKIRQKVLKLLCERNIGTLFCYVSFGSEADTSELIRELLGKVEIYVPYTYCGEMLPVRLDRVQRIAEVDKRGNAYALNEPKSSDYLPLCPDGRYRIGATIVPMLAYNKDLYRLGYGGGYYDRFLKNCDTFKIGIAFDEQLIDDLAVEEHDVALDAIVTPSAILRRF